MSDAVTEKMTQKVANMLEEMSEINILIRRLDSTKETLNKINERNDAIHAAIVHIEKGLKLDDKRLLALEAQTKSLEAQTAALMTGLEVQNQQTELLREVLVQQKKQGEHFEQTARALNQALLSQEDSINRYTAKMAKELKDRIETSSYNQGKWLIILGGVLIAAFLLLALRL